MRFTNRSLPQVPAFARKIDPAPSRKAGSEQRRRRVLEAARACFGEAGFAGATIGAIAERAGVSNGLLYQFFRSKEHLFEVVLREIMRRLGARAGAARRRAREREPGARGHVPPLRRVLPRGIRCCPRCCAATRASSSRASARPGATACSRTAISSPRCCAAASRRASSSPTSTCRAVADVICQLQADYSARAYRRDPGYPDSPAIIDAATRFILDAVRA